MPVTIKTAPHDSVKFKGRTHNDSNSQLPEKSADEFFRWDETFERCGSKVVASSFDPGDKVKYQDNGFVHTVLEAYNHHYDLVIRPDDVWISILCQLSCHINSHAKEVRKHFVSHEGKKKLVILLQYIEPHQIDWVWFSRQMTNLMDEDMVDKDFKRWVMPAFSTTTKIDTDVTAMMMMAWMKSYYHFVGIRSCGIPTVTLDGTKDDWLEIQNRLERLEEWDDVTRKWHVMLRPVLRKFIAAFDGEVDSDFWEHVVSNERLGSGGTDAFAGWITAFCAFDQYGNFIDRFGYKSGGRTNRTFKPYVLDGVSYPMICEMQIPSGTADVEVLLRDDLGRLQYETVLVAGNMGMKVVPGEEQKGDTVQNVPMWFCCLKDQKKVEEEELEKQKEMQFFERRKADSHNSSDTSL